MQNKIKVDESIVSKVQKANVEMEAKRSLLAFLLSSGTSMEDEVYKNYEKSYFDSFYDFEKEKSNIEKNIVKSKYPNAINWSLDYETQEITVVN